MPQCYRNDALHSIALHAIDTVHRLHKNGGGGAPLSEMSHLFGFPLSENDFATLGRRGDIIFSPTADGGKFHNSAEPMVVSTVGMKISLPREITGSYAVFIDGFSMTFDGDRTISGSFLLLKSKLEAVHVDKEQIKVDLGGDTFDQCITHG